VVELRDGDQVPEELVAVREGVRCMDQHHSGACVALDPRTNLCTIYEDRPEVCRLFSRGSSLCRQLFQRSFQPCLPSPSMSLLVYTYAKCSTCRDAVKWLRSQGITFVEKPIYTEPPSLAELKRMLGHQNGNLRRLFNTSGIQYREHGLATKLPALSEADALRLLAGDGRLVKRPFVLGDGLGLVGFDPAAWAAALR
jgi:arsenate reductase